MAILNLNQIDIAKSSLSAELCVVGAGVAGLLLATRLAKNGRKVIVLESGNEYFDEEIHQLNGMDFSSGNYSRALSGRYRGLGGTSSRWGGRIIPLSDCDTGSREHVELPAWPIDISRLDRYGDEIEQALGVARGAYDGVSGIPVWKPYEPRTQFRLRWAKCPSFRKCNIATLLRRQLESNPNIDIWLGATACEFELNREVGLLRGIVARNFSGKSIIIRADHFVIAAGTIETTRLLLLINRASDDRIFHPSSGLGHYFQDHLKLEIATVDRSDVASTNQLFGYRYINSTRRDLHLELGHQAQVTAGVGSSFAYLAMEFGNSQLAGLKKVMEGVQLGKVDFEELLRLSRNIGLLAKGAYWRLSHKQLFVPSGVNFKIMLCAEQLPNWNNRISLSCERDRLGVPKALLRWQAMPSEERTLRATISHLSEYWRSVGLAHLCPLHWTAAVLNESASLGESAEPCAHPSGTTRMGMDPHTSVVSPSLRCHAISNVSVVSASVFPTAGSANPTFTIMKLAYYFADMYAATRRFGAA
ncbi:choline dehydrogenase-like flavoprotein [Mycoplana sp. BE70]|uniref:GMC oxidoreductase n=1 Tax=Mycoplana sp. BE70 TaxID=2817775 RepID=UPI00285922A2|nr:GMC oxidoreductase [Mycoplana sp. BE70]MDR6757021.1 choline dehydrogenase-like flavoprotein [Mycoplana sp. BE70]